MLRNKFQSSRILLLQIYIFRLNPVHFAKPHTHSFMPHCRQIPFSQRINFQLLGCLQWARRPALECNEETSSGMQRCLQVQCFKKTECSAITNQSRGRMYHHNPSTARELHPYSVNSTNQFLREIMKIIFRMYLVKKYPDPIAVH